MMVLLKREPSAAASGLRVWREPLVWPRGRAVGRKRRRCRSSLARPCVYRKAGDRGAGPGRALAHRL